MSNVAKEAEKYVKEWYAKKGVELVKHEAGEFGFDFKTRDNKLFVEVKGTKAKKISNVLFRYLTNLEYVRIKECKRRSLTHEVHLICGVGSNSISHYIIPGEHIVKIAVPEISWSVPIRKGISVYKVFDKK